MKKPKVAIIVSHPIQHFCPQYVSYAKSELWDIKVFFASALGYKEFDSPGYGAVIKWENLGIEKFPNVFLNDGAVIIPSRKLDAPELEDHLAQYDPDAIIVYGYMQKYQRRALAWGRKFKKKILYISDSELRRKRNFVVRMMKSIMLRHYFKKIDAFLTVGNANEDYYTHYGASAVKFFRTPFSIDIDSYNNSYVSKEQIRKEQRGLLGIDEGEIVCSIVGQLVPSKRQGDLIEALLLLEQLSDLRFTGVVIGSGPSLEPLQKMARKVKKNKVIFTKFVMPEQLPKYYAATDIYVHLSEKDAHSLAISEALYMGCPLIISDRCGSYGPTDDLQNGHNGFVCECGNFSQLAKQIQRLAGDEKLRKQFGEFSHAYAEQAQETSHNLGLKAALTATLLVK